MIDRDKPLSVYDGTIYTQDGIGIDNMAVVFSKFAGLVKYGDIELIRNYYSEVTKTYREAGYNDMAEDLGIIEFDRLSGVLDVDEICIFVNYMIMCSANADKIMKMLSMRKAELKNEIAKLKKCGY